MKASGMLLLSYTCTPGHSGQGMKHTEANWQEQHKCRSITNAEMHRQQQKAVRSFYTLACMVLCTNAEAESQL